MGMRHAPGYIELRRHFDQVRTFAVCDPHLDPAATVPEVSGEDPSEDQQAFRSLAETTESGAQAMFGKPIELA